jgi:hypothetical protein
MNKLKAAVAVLLCSFVFFADAEDVTLSGRVVDKETLAGIAGVNISMKNNGLTTISKTDGSFILSSTATFNALDKVEMTDLFSVKNNMLVFSSRVSGDASSRIELFSINGKKIASLKADNLNDGRQGVALPKLTPGITCIRIYTENQLFTGSLFSIGKNITLKDGKLALKNKGNPQFPKKAKITAEEIDTLVASKEGYLTQVFH